MVVTAEDIGHLISNSDQSQLEERLFKKMKNAVST